MVTQMRKVGIMPNYKCTAACRHCLYACSPKRKSGYMKEPMMHMICYVLRELGCRTAHLGGGEPFIDFEGITNFLCAALQHGITIEYIETNASWVDDEDTVKERLSKLKYWGARALCISVDPFHLEYVPLNKPLRLAKICEEVGFKYFFWQERFLPMMRNLDVDNPHSRSELEKALGKNYVYDTAQAYGIHMGGRAINIEQEYLPLRQIAPSYVPCSGLLSGNHCHIDMYLRFIPPGCTGIAIELKDALIGLPPGKYPALEALLSKGIGGLLDYAKSLNFIPDEKGYTTACAMCFHIRRWLSKLGCCPELDRVHYTHSLRNY